MQERGEIGATYFGSWYMLYTLAMNAFAIYICMQAYKSVYILSSLGHGNLLGKVQFRLVVQPSETVTKAEIVKVLQKSQNHKYIKSWIFSSCF